MWIDGKALTQVSAAASVTPGTFYVDYATSKLYLGSSPEGHSVRASDIAKAASVQSTGSTLRGIGFQRFAPSVPDMGAVTAEKDNVTIENVVIVDNAGTGLHAVGANITFRNVTLARNGMLGGSASYADNFKALGILAYGNNTELFNNAPVSGGFKISRSRGVTFRDSSFTNNAGPGLWFDESVYNGQAIHNDIINNVGHGLITEISSNFVIGDNVITGNTGDGFKLNDTSVVNIWNNTIAGNGRNLNIVQDTRRASNKSVPGHDPRQAFPDSTMTWVNKDIVVRNNILAAGKGNCLLCVEDYSKALTAEAMSVSAIGNVYARPTKTSPSWTNVWSRGSANPGVYTTLDAFKKSTGQENRSMLIEGAAVTSGWKPVSEVIASQTAVSVPLPSSMATLLGKPVGAAYLGASLN
ncbi:hypothetical protein AS189_16520 [Arthrobacter alpinus]|uniref:Right handed beta helix domain-containing protein n=2 Tax=Arthrobacter alpinus TaxID=656366 RepID=A0A0S2M265_9MICC|nr:hypothetical protein AS189_16520 [Arthrobacter alpinus]